MESPQKPVKAKKIFNPSIFKINCNRKAKIYDKAFRKVRKRKKILTWCLFKKSKQIKEEVNETVPTADIKTLKMCEASGQAKIKD